MHIIEHIRVKNFRSIKDSEFELAAYTPLVGYNNAGKSNLLLALQWLLRKRSLVDADFFDISQPIEIFTKITGITDELFLELDEKHQTKIEPFIYDGTINICRNQPAPNASAKEILLSVLKINESGDAEWVINPAGIDQAIAHLFPEPIMIGAMENSTEDVAKFRPGTTIGQLLSEITEPVKERQSENIRASLHEVREKLSALGSQKDEDLCRIDDLIEREIATFFPGVTAKTHIPVPEFEDFLKGGTIQIFERDYGVDDGREAASLGHGAQRSIQMALIRCLSQIKKGQNKTKRTTLLLIDEPELYLHPQAIENVRVALRRLAQDGYQVVFTTHSANMISKHDAQFVLLVRRNVEQGTFPRKRLRRAVTEAIQDGRHQSEVLFSLTYSTQILFSERIVIAEGKTERYLLPSFFEATHGRTLVEDKVALIEVSGAPNVPRAMHVLSAMGLPVKSILDLDFAFRGALEAGLLQQDNADIRACKQIFQQLAAADEVSLDAAGLPMRHHNEPPSKAYEKLALNQAAVQHISNLHDILLQHNIWLWKKGAIEAHIGIEAKTPSVWAILEERIIDEGDLNSLRDAEGISELCAWIARD